MSWAGMVAWADVRGVDAAALRGRLALVVDEADLAQRRTGIRLVEQRRHGLAVEHGGRGGDETVVVADEEGAKRCVSADDRDGGCWTVVDMCVCWRCRSGSRREGKHRALRTTGLVGDVTRHGGRC